MDAMRQVVPASGAFFCFGTEDTRAYADSSRLVDGIAAPLKAPDGQRLTQALSENVHDFALILS